MKKKNVALVALIMATTIVVAQQHEKRKVHREDNIKKALSLTDEQDASIKSIRQKYGSQFKMLKKDSILTRNEVKTEMKKLSEQRNAEYKAVLSEAQYSQWSKLQEQRNHDSSGRRDKNQIQQADRMKTALSLTEEQYTKVKADEAKFLDRYRDLKSDPTVSTEIALREMRRLREERNNALKGVLTEDQYTRWLALKSEYRNRKN